MNGQPTGLFTQLEKIDIDIDFRVSGLPHAVVKQAENVPRSRAREEDRESSSSREALQADLQQNKVYNPFSNNSKAMIREMGTCRVIRVMRNNSKNAMLRMPSLLDSRSGLLHLRTPLG